MRKKGFLSGVLSGLKEKSSQTLEAGDNLFKVGVALSNSLQTSIKEVSNSAVNTIENELKSIEKEKINKSIQDLPTNDEVYKDFIQLVYRLAIFVSHIDGDLHENEVEELNNIKDSLFKKNEEVPEEGFLSIDTLLRDINSFLLKKTIDEKSIFLTYMTIIIDGVVMADNIIHEKEEEFLEKWNFTYGEFINLKESFISNWQNKLNDVDLKKSSNELIDKVSSLTLKDVGKGSLNVAKTFSGVKAYKLHKESKNIKNASDEKLQNFSRQNEINESILKNKIKTFSDLRLEIMNKTIGRFLTILEQMNQRYKEKTYSLLSDIEIPAELYFNEVKSLHMNSKNLLMSTGASASVGAAALTTVPGLVTAGVVQIGAASTGTSIAALSGAAQTNAVMAWLGGGSLASGGGGMAAGAVTLGAITWTVTGGFAVAMAGTLASRHYSQKLTEVKNFEKEVEIHCAQLEANWDMMKQIEKRVDEIMRITIVLEDKIETELNKLEPLVNHFDSNNDGHLNQFKKTAILVKGMSENVQIPLLTENGLLTDESARLKLKTEEIINKSLQYEDAN